jgi:hypothetical protein
VSVVEGTMPEERVDFTKDMLGAITDLLAVAREAAAELESVDLLLHGTDGWRTLGKSTLERQRHEKLVGLRDRLAEGIRDTHAAIQVEFDKYALKRNAAMAEVMARR